MSQGTQVGSKKRVGRYPYSNVIFSITTALFMIGLFALLALNANNLTQRLRKSVEIQVNLNKDLLQVEIDEVKAQLLDKEFVDATGEADIQFISEEEAAEQMIQETGEDFIGFLGENPLRDAFIINIKSAFYSAERMKEISIEIEQISGVYEIVYEESLVDEINANITKVGFVISIFVLIFLFTVVILINNSIKLALFSQRFLIRSMQLVGATPFFIKKPFLLRATLQGVIGGLIASTFLTLLLWFFIRQINELAAIQNHLLTSLVFLGLTLLGGLIGFLSAYSAVSRYLKMKLDELY